eukprot:gene5569-5806_t
MAHQRAFQQSAGKAVLRPSAGRSRAVKVMAVQKSQNFVGMAAAAASALLLAATPVQAEELRVCTSASRGVANPAALVAESSQQGLLQRLLNVGKSKIPSVVKEDPFGADRAQSKTVANTKHPIPIITEQEAVAPEAFPNPAENISPKPPVLAAAEGDEAQGRNAGQFKGLTKSGRQGLINKKSPAKVSASAMSAVNGSPVSFTSSTGNPVAMVAEGQGKGLLQKLKDVLPRPPSPVQEDPFGADQFQSTTIADTKRPMPIITEQEAVAPEAFPNPSENISPKPPVLAAAEGDEQLGCNANQFEGIDASCRQGLIDAKSPAEASGQ